MPVNHIIKLVPFNVVSSSKSIVIPVVMPLIGVLANLNILQVSHKAWYTYIIS
jgi:hypothetical protein